MADLQHTAVPRQDLTNLSFESTWPSHLLPAGLLRATQVPPPTLLHHPGRTSRPRPSNFRDIPQSSDLIGFDKQELEQNMCTQEIIWCSCGHGELLPIVKCLHTEVLDTCWTVVHGDHRIVVEMQCSFCRSGLTSSERLGTKARPEGQLAEKIEKAKVEKQQSFCEDLVGSAENCAENTAGQLPLELQDVVHTDWENFTLDPELWQYV
ncbi:hypothetical protein Q7P37_007294 [Cladosporium fusiforme]